jgi:choline dehydrogenase-like flavoprotein
MNQPNPRRMHDAIIVGGSYAGVSAGLQLARARRDVLVLDAGQRRNRRATASHGFLGQDGQDQRQVDVPLPHPRASRGRDDGPFRGRATVTGSRPDWEHPTCA